MDAKRGRKMNWTRAEVDELRNSYLEFRGIIDGRLSVTLTNAQKDETWRGIQERINAHSSEYRTLEEIKKKLSDTKSAVKKRERERRQQCRMTGGGQVPALNDFDEKMIEAIGEVAVAGFSGTDTFNDSIGTDGPGLDCAYIKGSEKNTELSASTLNQNDRKRKQKKNDSEDETEKVINLLESQNTTLKLILEEQKMTNRILSQLFPINLEP